MRRTSLAGATGIPSALFALLFAGAAALQFNDPDPALWIAAYATTAGLATAAAFGRAHFWISAPFALLFALWAATLLPSWLASETGAFASFRMQSPSHEKSREAIGLLICASYATWIALACRRSRRLNSP